MPKDVPSPRRGLPNAHYVDPATHALEEARLLRGGWMAVAVGAQVPHPGDALPLDVLGAPLLLMRGRDGALRLFENVCRHRGMILVDAPRRIEGAIRCPYHSWCYDHAGALVATPHVGGPGMNRCEGIERSELGLREVRTHLWRDVVFANLSGDAPPFEDHAREAMARWAAFDAPLHHGGGFTLEVDGNWKLAVENYCESYHLPWVHPGLNSYSRLEDHYDILLDGASGQGTHVYRQLVAEDGGRFPDFADLPAKWDTAAEYLALYPNVLFGVHRDHAYAILIEPLGQGRTREHVHLYYPAPQVDADLAARNLAQWRVVFEEDVGVVEGMQRGRRAPGFDGGTFSPAMDGATAAFHAWVAARI